MQPVGMTYRLPQKPIQTKRIASRQSSVRFGDGGMVSIALLGTIAASIVVTAASWSVVGLNQIWKKYKYRPEIQRFFQERRDQKVRKQWLNVVSNSVQNGDVGQLKKPETFTQNGVTGKRFFLSIGGNKFELTVIRAMDGIGNAFFDKEHPDLVGWYQLKDNCEHNFDYRESLVVGPDGKNMIRKTFTLQTNKTQPKVLQNAAMTAKAEAIFARLKHWETLLENRGDLPMEKPLGAKLNDWCFLDSTWNAIKEAAEAQKLPVAEEATKAASLTVPAERQATL